MGTDFFAYSRRKIEKDKEEGHFEAAHNREMALRCFVNFLGKEELSLNELTPELMVKFEEWLNTKGRKQSTTRLYLYQISSVYNIAVKEGADNEVANDLAVREIQNIDSTQPYNPETLPTPAMINEQNMQNMQNNQTAMSTASLLTDIKNPYEVTAESVQYLNGFIRTQIGRRVSIDFLVGSNTIVTKSGYLLGVAANYILINELDTNDLTTCDFYNIKFIRFYFN